MYKLEMNHAIVHEFLAIIAIHEGDPKDGLEFSWMRFVKALLDRNDIDVLVCRIDI
jgi:hypothetical protein